MENRIIRGLFKERISLESNKGLTNINSLLAAHYKRPLVCMKYVNSDFTQTSDVRDPRTADSGRNWTAQYSTWNLRLRLFFWTTNHLVSKLEPWERHSKPDRCLYFWTTNHLTSWLVPCVLCSKPVWTSFRLISDAYRSNGLHCHTTDRFNSIRGHWCGWVIS